MKTKPIFFALILVLLLPGCIVKSLHPFYTDGNLMYKAELAGTWTDGDSNTWTISRHMKQSGFLKPETPDLAYNIVYTDKDGSSNFIAHLFTLDKQLYLDFYPAKTESNTDLGGYHFIPAHTLAQVELKGNSIMIRWYNEEWLMKLFNQNRIRIAHERVPYDIDDKDKDHDQVILTAPTAELQKFILKYGHDPDAFKQDKVKNDNGYTFMLKKSNSVK
jgi:hypothetical protein